MFFECAFECVDMLLNGPLNALDVPLNVFFECAFGCVDMLLKWPLNA